MSWLRAIPFLFTLLAFVLQPASASAFGNAHPEARVSAFELVAMASVGASAETSPGLHEGIAEAYDENASGYRFAAREAGGSVGAMARARYVPSPKHGSTARRTPRGVASPAPADGQAALDNAVELGNGTRRVGIDYDAGQFVVFDQTNNVAARVPEFHGHVRAWSDLTPQMRSALQRAGMADHRGRILTD